MYSFPSTSQIRRPSPRATEKGSPPTLRNARTGEFTPPGMRLVARANRSAEWEVILLRRSPGRPAMYLCSALDTSAATTILSALASRRGSQVVRSRSAKPLFGVSIPPPASLIPKSFECPTSTRLTAGCQRIRMQTDLEEVLQCPQQTRLESKL